MTILSRASDDTESPAVLPFVRPIHITARFAIRGERFALCVLGGSVFLLSEVTREQFTSIECEASSSSASGPSVS
jgi:hypothetical protein